MWGYILLFLLFRWASRYAWSLRRLDTHYSNLPYGVVILTIQASRIHLCMRPIHLIAATNPTNGHVWAKKSHTWAYGACYMIVWPRFYSLNWLLSSSLRRLGETFISVALDISQAYDIVLHKSLFCKLTSLGFYPSISSIIHAFHSNLSISVAVDDYCSPPKPINSGVPHGFAL